MSSRDAARDSVFRKRHREALTQAGRDATSADEDAASTAALLAEFHAAVSHPETDLLWLRRTLHDEEHAELVAALELGDYREIARELADVVYVAYGTAHAYGIDLDVALAEVHRANMQKAHGPRRADGKAMKPEGFVPPDMTEAVRRVA